MKAKADVTDHGRFALVLMLGACMFTLTRDAAAVEPGAEEFHQRDAWVERGFADVPGGSQATLKLLYQDVADGVSRCKSWRGTQFQIGSKTYSHGLAFNSTKHIEVNLPRPGKRFVAEVGLENNDDTRRGSTMGQGSVTFHVLVDGKERFTSPVMRLKDEPVRVDVALDGQRSFEIRIKDAGDGRGWDQGLWAEAVVELSDGVLIRLQDLPWADVARYNPYVLSCKLDGQPSTNFLAGWRRVVLAPEVLNDRTVRKVRYSDPECHLELTIEAEIFKSFPAVEWVVRAANRGPTDSPLISELLPIDAALFVPTSGNPLLHWARGAVASFDDFAPQQTEIKPEQEIHLQPGGGRSSSQVMPFFNLCGNSGGVVIGIGWSGEWAARFVGKDQGTVITRIGMANTRLRLHPGEEIRTPRILLIFFEGDRWRGQNLLRQFILAHHRPKRDGKPLVSPITCGNWGGTRAEVHLDNIRKIIAHNLPIEYYWIDAEWYGKPGPAGSWAINVGNWSVKKDLYPQGFKPLSTALRQSGRELMLWFEPERVFKDTPWRSELTHWLIDIGQDNALFNLGSSEARKFLTDFISSRIDEFGLGCYRQDFNMDPLPFWQAADPPDRQGITEIRYVEGLYAFWDELLTRHPRLIIDNCASGGRRIDLETIGRATPFWRSDGPRDPIAHQCHTYGLMAWIPFSSTSQDKPG
ncbi:MAG: alpha-galactosidase, partial [Verrucomicrobiae bacterium]|nr:alpha-galactosidase [Verrucomicrobiae bacterium]